VFVIKKILVFFLGLFFLGSVSVFAILYSVKKSLPQLVTIQDYEPLMVTEVFDRNKKKIGEFARERRTLVPFEKIPKKLIQAFMAAEDDQFFEHSGVNYQSILRATLANMRAGRSVQGGFNHYAAGGKNPDVVFRKNIHSKVKRYFTGH
jgi:penicillin-binding protein 1A